MAIEREIRFRLNRFNVFPFAITADVVKNVLILLVKLLLRCSYDLKNSMQLSSSRLTLSFLPRHCVSLNWLFRQLVEKTSVEESYKRTFLIE